MSSCGNPAVETNALMPRRVKFDKSKFCVKCKTTLGNIVIRHAVYCKDCFYASMMFKFRRCLGPSINPTPDGSRRVKLKASGNLLLAFSGGLGSTVLLDLVSRNYFKADSGAVRLGGKDHPRNEDVWTKAAVCYVEVCSAFPEMRDRTDDVRAVVERYERFEFIPLRIEDAFDSSWWEKIGRKPLQFDLGVGVTNEDLVFSSISTSEDLDPVTRLKLYMTSLPTQTAVRTTIRILIRLLLLHTAHSTASSHLLFGTSLTSLSISLISSISQGGGFVVREEFQEEWTPTLNEEQGTQRWAGIRINRPLREIGIKECAAWAWWTGLQIVGQERLPEAKQDIGDLTKNFIIGLERDFPSTVSTIARTCDKLAPKEGGQGSCLLCERPVQREVQDWKRKIAIRSFDPPSTISTDWTSIPTLHPISLTPYLCYACHTTLTSRSSRGTTLGSQATLGSSVALPVWVRSRLSGIDLPPEDDHRSGITADERVNGEIWERKKMGTLEMNKAVSNFLLDVT